ncbi:MAG: FlgD immunoglobulin-like domain containing protein [Calditrichia bacterium]
MKSTIFRLAKRVFLIHYSYIILMVVASTTLMSAQKPVWQWANSGGGTRADLASKVAIDSQGNSYIAGYFSREANFDGIQLSGGNDEILIAKYKANGTLAWAKSAGGSLYDRALDIAVDNADNIIISGYFSESAQFDDTTLQAMGSQSEIFIAKYTSDGTLIWALREGSTNSEVGSAIAVDTENNILLAGIIRGTAQIGDTVFTSVQDEDVIVARYSEDGDFLWAAQGKSSGSAVPYGISSNEDGTIAVVGAFYNQISFNGLNLNANGDADGYVVTFNREGNVQWSRTMGGPEIDYALDVAINASGDIIVGGFFSGLAFIGGTPMSSNGSTDGFIISYTHDGALKWANQEGSGGTDGAIAVAVDSNDNVLVVSEFTNSINFPDTTFSSLGWEDITVSAYSTTGSYLWVSHAGGTSIDNASAIAVRNDRIRIAGSFYQNVTFGNDTLSSSGQADTYIAGLSYPTLTGIVREEYVAIDFTLGQNYPNPFNPSTQIPYSHASRATVSIEIFDYLGRRVRTLVNQTQAAGNYLVFWNGADDQGNRVASGIYIYRLKINNAVAKQRKMILLK